MFSKIHLATSYVVGFGTGLVIVDFVK